MTVVPAGLHHVRPGTEPHLRFSFRRLDVRARQEHDLHGVGVRVKGSGESRRKLEERAERALDELLRTSEGPILIAKSRAMV